MTQSENINLYLQTLPTYELSDAEVTDLLSLARQGNADAFIELVRANIKPMVSFKRSLALQRFSPLEHVVVTAIGITRCVRRLLNSRPKPMQSKGLRRGMTVSVEYAVRFCNRDCRASNVDLFSRRMERFVANFILANDRMPSPDEVIEKLKAMDDHNLLDEQSCEMAKTMYERRCNRHVGMTASQHLAKVAGSAPAFHIERDALKLRLSEQCLMAIADEIGEALCLSPERIGEIKGDALSWFYSCDQYCLMSDVNFN